MIDRLKDLPERIAPYILLQDPSQPVPVASGPFRLVGPSDALLDGHLVFRWLPSTAVEFEGSYAYPHPDFDAPDWALVAEGASAFHVPVLLTHVAFGSEKSTVRGIAEQAFTIGAATPFDTMRFCLANFPEYMGARVRYETEGRAGVVAGRLQLRADRGECRLDAIPEASEAVKRATRDAGFLISHVGEWLPSSGVMTVHEAEAVVATLHFWFGFMRGTWAGPLFPQGSSNANVVWRQFAAWKVGESRAVPTWLPQRRPLDLSSAFHGFAQRWGDPAWRDPLKSAISWFVEANSSQVALESKIVLAQIALELLAWVHVVETQQLHSRSDFNRLSAAGRIRILLQQLGIPPTVPDYLSHLPALYRDDAFDGPGVITSVRNAFVHSSEKKRKTTDRIDGPQLLECGQLALQYVELVLLAVCGHDGYYAQRGWCGRKGEDEVRVPWTLPG